MAVERFISRAKKLALYKTATKQHQINLQIKFYRQKHKAIALTNYPLNLTKFGLSDLSKSLNCPYIFAWLTQYKKLINQNQLV